MQMVGWAEGGHLKAEADIGICYTSDCFDCLKDFSIWLFTLPHEVGYYKGDATRNALDAMDKDAPVALHCCLHAHRI